METKTMILNIDWLNAIDGLTVEKAREYLLTLDQSHVLSCYLEGDTHGCEIVSSVHYDVPMTDKEIFAKLEKHYTKEIAIYTKAKEQHIKDGRTSRAENCDRLLTNLNNKFDEIKLKYNIK
jgi:hypothetical protein